MRLSIREVCLRYGATKTKKLTNDLRTILYSSNMPLSLVLQLQQRGRGRLCENSLLWPTLLWLWAGGLNRTPHPVDGFSKHQTQINQPATGARLQSVLTSTLLNMNSATATHSLGLNEAIGCHETNVYISSLKFLYCWIFAVLVKGPALNLIQKHCLINKEPIESSFYFSYDKVRLGNAHFTRTKWSYHTMEGKFTLHNSKRSKTSHTHFST